MSTLFEKNQSPVSQDKIWYAEYDNGDIYSEFDFETTKENSFYDINREEIVRFGLVGNGVRFFYEISSGMFKLAGKMIEIIYKTKDREYYLTGQQTSYNDIISYKDAESFINLKSSSGTVHSTITQYNFGYKTNLEIDEINFSFKAICKSPNFESPYINIWLVADKDLNGNIQIKKNGRIIEEIYAPLKARVGGELNWIIK